MAYNGSGLFARLFSWQNDAANSINIRADRMDAEMDGIASGLSNCITRDGQGKPSAAIDWNGQNLNNVSALTATSGAFIGAVTGATGNFSGAVNGSTGTFTGAVTGTTAAFSGLVTALTPPTGNRSTSLATTQMFSDEFAKSFVGSGYQKLPSGLILQWGSFSQADAAGATSGWGFTLPIAWSAGMLQGFITPANNLAAGVTASVEGSTTTTMSGFTYSPNSVNRSYRVFAIGY